MQQRLENGAVVSSSVFIQPLVKRGNEACTSRLTDMRVESASLWDRKRSRYPRTSCNIALLFSSYIQETIRWYFEIEPFFAFDVKSTQCELCCMRASFMYSRSIQLFWSIMTTAGASELKRQSSQCLAHLCLLFTYWQKSSKSKRWLKLQLETTNDESVATSFCLMTQWCHPPQFNGRSCQKQTRMSGGFWHKFIHLFVNRLTRISLESIWYSGICCHHLHHQTDA